MKSISKAPKPPPTPILLPSIPSNTKPLNMTIDDGLDLTAHHNNNHHLLDWLEDSITFLPSFLDEPYTIPIEITSDEWWTPDLEQSHHVQTPATSTNLTDQTPNPQTQLSKKRKLPAFPRTSSDDDDEVQRKPAIGRKTYGKGINGGSSNGGSKESRWAEQLLNPCAAAIDAGNVSRVQHLIYVLHELSSPSGDPNHRLAAHGLRALALHLSSSGTAIGIPASPTVTSFSSSEPRLFRSSLIKFNEVSPWFAFPNSLANSSILQASASHRSRGIHVVDIGVSHGVQWPTLLEALTRRSGGAPPLVRLTVASAAPAPFSESPPGYDFSSHLLRYAKSIDLNLQIDRAETIGELELGEDETLIVCVQFRGGDGDELIRSVRGVDPDLVVMSEIEGGELREGGGFAAGFVRRAGLMWRFLESTSAAFKGRDCAERRLMEGEAAEMMAAEAAKGRRRERMAAAGFGEIGFGEEAVDAGRALLRKYDGNWEMRQPAKYPATAADEAVGLWWKGQPVSCCSLWKPIKESGAVGVGTS